MSIIYFIKVRIKKISLIIIFLSQILLILPSFGYGEKAKQLDGNLNYHLKNGFKIVEIKAAGSSPGLSFVLENRKDEIIICSVELVNNKTYCIYP